MKNLIIVIGTTGSSLSRETLLMVIKSKLFAHLSMVEHCQVHM